MIHQALGSRLAREALLRVGPFVEAMVTAHASECTGGMSSVAGESGEVGSGNGVAHVQIVRLGEESFQGLRTGGRSGRSPTLAVPCQAFGTPLCYMV